MRARERDDLSTASVWPAIIVVGPLRGTAAAAATMRRPFLSLLLSNSEVDRSSPLVRQQLQGEQEWTSGLVLGLGNTGSRRVCAPFVRLLSCARTLLVQLAGYARLIYSSWAPQHIRVLPPRARARARASQLSSALVSRRDSKFESWTR